jgi:hypothetical protein
MDRRVRGFVVAAFFGVFASPAAAQSGPPLAFQISAGVPVPLGEFGDLAGSGYGLSFGAGFQFLPDVAVSASYSWARFPSEVLGGDLTDAGFTLGVSGVLSSLNVPVLPWAGFGVSIHRLRISDAEDQPDQPGPGFTLSGGVLVPITTSLRLSPSLSFLRYRSPIPGREETVVSHLTAGVAVNYSPW